MNVTDFMFQLRAELIKVADDPPFRFLNTKKQDAMDYLAKRTHFQGYSEEEISAVEAAMGTAFPLLLREFLLQMGKSGSVLLSGETLIEPSEIPDRVSYIKETVRDLNEDNQLYCEESGEIFEEIKLALPDDAIVFMRYQGVQYFYVLPTTEDDPEMWVLNEYEEIVNLGLFSEFLSECLESRQEYNKMAHGRGGWFLTIKEGFPEEMIPSGNIRPLDYAHDIIEDRPPGLKLQHWLNSLIRRS